MKCDMFVYAEEMFAIHPWMNLNIYDNLSKAKQFHIFCVCFYVKNAKRREKSTDSDIAFVGTVVKGKRLLVNANKQQSHDWYFNCIFNAPLPSFRRNSIGWNLSVSTNSYSHLHHFFNTQSNRRIKRNEKSDFQIRAYFFYCIEKIRNCISCANKNIINLSSHGMTVSKLFSLSSENSDTHSRSTSTASRQTVHHFFFSHSVVHSMRLRSQLAEVLCDQNRIKINLLAARNKQVLWVDQSNRIGTRVTCACNTIWTPIIQLFSFISIAFSW